MTECEGSITWGDQVTVLRLTQARTCRPGGTGHQCGTGWNGSSGPRYARTAGVGYRFEPVEVEQLRLMQTSLQRIGRPQRDCAADRIRVPQRAEKGQRNVCAA